MKAPICPAILNGEAVVGVTVAVEFENVVKDYPRGLLDRRPIRAVSGMTFRVEAGEVFGLVGPNRAGKTTLVKLLLSLCRPTAGRVARLGKPAADRMTLSRTGYVHENQAFPRYLTATGLLEFYGALSLLPEPYVRRRAAQLLEAVGLADRASEPIARFSKGMIQRLGVAQALINEPDLLVLDEPSEGLDLPGRQMIRGLVADHKKQGRTVLLVSHLLSEIEQLCDRVAVVAGGRLVFLGTVPSLVKDRTAGGKRTMEQAVGELYTKAAAQPVEQLTH
jgi:ABC-2 type transport system ATP-binding protein